jgi:hypothetical protein
MTKPRRHRVEFTAHKKVKEPTEVTFTTIAGERVDFVAKKPVTEEVDVNFLARGKRKP